MIRMRNFIILATMLFVINGGCWSNSTESPKDPELVKRVNEMLDKIDTPKSHQDIVMATGSASDFGGWRTVLERRSKFLIENPDIALPLMFERLDKEKPSSKAIFERYGDG